MLTTLKILFAAAAGGLLGLAATYAAVENGVNFTTLHAGPWSAVLDAGTAGGDPYERARLASRAELPLGLAEGLSFIAANDSSGAPLRSRCDYVISHDMPAARYWSLTAMTPRGEVIANSGRRYGFTSAEIVRDEGGDFHIAVSADAQSGNWLPIRPDLGRFVLLLRLYDTPVAASAKTLGVTDMPSIDRKGCR